jgi:hypothetical protein
MALDENEVSHIANEIATVQAQNFNARFYSSPRGYDDDEMAAASQDLPEEEEQSCGEDEAEELAD